ncbi:MAG TPA: glycosyltransferase family 4 protein [Terriglobales bacterium]|nr:glycosyltransferase family 4 protein [Terriglobales bacterium]
MRIALIAPPFISIPPKQYGGTELFIGNLALGLKDLGLEVVVYTNGESTVEVERKWLYAEDQWPLKDDVYFSLRDMEHHAWAVEDAARDCDLMHVNNLPGITYSRFVPTPFVYTVHHPHDAPLAEIYQHYPNIHYACISDFQAAELDVPRRTTIHHGIDVSQYQMKESKQDYLAFLGRIAPVKGVHLAIEVAKKAGIPLKIAGEIQPLFKDYWEQQVKPHVDGKFIEFIGEVGLAEKNELLGNARAMVFPIQWHEPFGLVMVESMACGTPVLAFGGGSVPEIVQEGVSGHICTTVEEMTQRAEEVNLPAQTVRDFVEKRFSVPRMAEAYLELYERVIERHRPVQTFSVTESKTA